MLLLELFSGTGSVGKVFKAYSWRVVSVDIRPAHADCTHVCDVMEISAKRVMEVHGRPDVIWAGPPCTQHSVARTTAKRPRDLIGADRLVRKALELIAELQPKCWFLENPYTGLLKSRPLMQGLPLTVVDYCRYGCRYKKRTAIWTNCPFPGLLCRKDERCGHWDGRHPEKAQRQGHTLNQLNAIPAGLCETVYQAAVSVV